MPLQRNLTQTDFDANPILVELEGVIGDVVSVYHPDQDVVLVPEIEADMVEARQAQIKSMGVKPIADQPIETVDTAL
jgi:hypothetical protein